MVKLKKQMWIVKNEQIFFVSHLIDNEIKGEVGNEYPSTILVIQILWKRGLNP